MKNDVKTLLRVFAVTASVLTSASAGAVVSRDQIRITGSSSAFPFATAVAEEFGKTSKFRTPVVEGFGTGGGLKEFCSGVGASTPDIANASRPIKASELNICHQNGVDDIIEIKFGYDGIVLANTKSAPHFKLSLKELYLALGAYVPAYNEVSGETALIQNPYKRWNEINPELPDQEIFILGPPPTSGTRDAFNERALEIGCNAFDEIQQLKQANPIRHKQVCHSIREDGVYIDSGENDNIIVQKLLTNDIALGIFAYSFLERNRDVLQAASMANKTGGYIDPTFDSILEREYPIYRSLFFYIKKAHVGVIPGISEFLAEFTSDRALGDYGYLVDRGLIPLFADERENYQQTADQLLTISLENTTTTAEERQ